MKKSDLKVGYVVKDRKGNLRMLMPTQKGLRFVRDCGLYIDYDDISEDLKNTGYSGAVYDIVEVYGFAQSTCNALDISTARREMLWNRPEAKKMTVAEICKELGYDVEIVKEGEQ